MTYRTLLLVALLAAPLEALAQPRDLCTSSMPELEDCCYIDQRGGLRCEPEPTTSAQHLLLWETIANGGGVWQLEAGNIPDTTTTCTLDSNGRIPDSCVGDGTDGGGGSALDAWPVGSVFLSVVSTSPATLLGGGTWSQIATGKMLVGIDSGDTDFDAAEETGGAKTHTLTVDEMPAHVHDENGPTSASGGSVGIANDTNASGSADSTLDTGSTGGGAAHSILNPYFVVYVWKRTA